MRNFLIIASCLVCIVFAAVLYITVQKIVILYTSLPNSDLIAYGVREIPSIREFVDTFEKVDHTITYRTQVMGQPSWTSTALVYDRYLLSMVADIDINEAAGTITIRNPILFNLTEILRFDKMSRVHGKNWLFGVEKWKKILNAKGDLSVLDDSILKNSPVPGLAEDYGFK